MGDRPQQPPTLSGALTRCQPSLDRLKSQNCRTNRHGRGKPLLTRGQGQVEMVEEKQPARVTSHAMGQDSAAFRGAPSLSSPTQVSARRLNPSPPHVPNQ